MTTRRLLAALALGLAAASPAVALDFGDITFTGLQLPTDASNGGTAVVGYAAGVTGFGSLAFNDAFIYDNANNNYFNLGFADFGGAGTRPQVSHDGTVVAGTILSPDFGGDPGTTFDGPYNTTGVWTQNNGQAFGSGTITDLLAIDTPTNSYAYENYVDMVNPPAAFDRNLGSGIVVSGDGNVVSGGYFRRQVRDPETNEILVQGGGMPLSFNLSTGTAIDLAGPDVGEKGQVLASNFDGSVVAGYTDNPFIPTVWVNGNMTQLTHPEGTAGRVTAVSDDGTRVAGYQLAFDASTGVTTQSQVIWDYNDATDSWDRTNIGRIDGNNMGLAEVTGITGDGQLVVGYDLSRTLIQGGGIAGSNNTGEATFWSQYTGLVQLEDFLTARGLNLTGLEIASIQGISPDGETLLAWAFTDTTINSITGLIIDVSDTPLNPEASEALRNTAIANLGTAASYAGDTYYGDWNQDGLVTQADLDILGAILDGIAGDLNGDLFVGVEDLDILLANWGDNVTPGSLIDGDANNDGIVNDLDLAIVQNNWGNGVNPGNVPEPTSLALLSLGGLALLRRRHRAA
ncbi:MAG: PEP-CTERM sorting domain-containing protein [Phycisphaerales bacterium JB063]